jgi:hypothetical protein
MRADLKKLSQLVRPVSDERLQQLTCPETEQQDGLVAVEREFHEEFWALVDHYRDENK